MGVQDRVYMRGRRPPPIAFGASWTLRLVVLLVAAFAAARGATAWFRWRGEPMLLLSREALDDGRWWTVLTSALLHADAWHLAFNALGLWFFGKLVEETLGGARYVAFFFVAAVLSHVPFVVAQYATGAYTATIGASGVVVAMLVFAAFRYPGLPVRVFLFPLALWQLAVLYVAVDLFGALSGPGGGTDHLTHLGGAVFGWFVHRFGLLPNLSLPRRVPKRHHEPGPYREGNVRLEVDRLLDKINAEGIGSLTSEEREWLRRNSARYD